MKRTNRQFEDSAMRRLLEDHARRGNTIVLVTGILVLLVIIATAYVTRTQAGRFGAAAVNNLNVREDVHHVVADRLASEIAQALFVRKATGTSSNAWRFPPEPDAIRYGVDPQIDALGNSLYPFNFAPYHVVPWTNWPDDIDHGGPLGTADDEFWPKGLGNPNGGGFDLFSRAVLAGEDNPLGNPGFGDTRWLRDLEPLRWDSNLDGMLDAYSHWRHMTNIARPDNAFRVCIDIADIEGAGLVTDLTIPIEQWLAAPHAYLDSSSGNSYLPGFPNTNGFWDQWNAWFSFTGYQTNFTNPNFIPPNFYCLSDLDGDGIRHNFVVNGISQDRPESEFIPDTARNWVSRVLCDTDGDGYTDSFWFLAPTPINSGIRTIVGVSIVDNCGMINANVATRFLRNNFDFFNPQTLRKTAGLTPTDIALVSDLQNIYINGNWNVGFFDNWENWYRSSVPLFGFPYYAGPNQYPPDAVAYDLQLNGAWQNHVNEIGMYVLGGAGTHQYPDMFLRLDYWRNSASRPLSVDPFSRYTPFGLGDEIELRMFAGNNYPWAATRFERSTEVDNTNARLLRSAVFNEESSEYLDQLTNYQLVRDLRKRLTLYNGVRNDIMPPWTWAFDRSQQFDDLDGDGIFPTDIPPDFDDLRLFQFGMRKFDLRLGPTAEILLPTGVPGSGSTLPFIDRINYNVTPPPAGYPVADFLDYNFKFGVALRDHLERCLIDTLPAGATGTPGSYYGSSADDVGKTKDLSAAFAANITQWRDSDSVVYLEEAVPVSDDANTRFLGMEPQPFLLEVFIGHVYKAYTVPATDVTGKPYTDAGNYLLLDRAQDSHRSTIVVVQIANPYDVPIDLSDYKISVFGQDLLLSEAVVYDHTSPGSPVTPAPTILEPATAERPTTAIYYSIDPDLINSPQLALGDTKWLNFLDLDRGPLPFPNDHPNTTIIASPGNAQWSTDRDVYDTADPDHAVELWRQCSPDPLNNPAWVVVDRIDGPDDTDPETHFGNQVHEMGLSENRPRPYPPGGLDSILVDIPEGNAWVIVYDIPPNPGDGNPPATEVIALGPPSLGYDQWVQWVRATRAWGVDLNLNGRYDPNEYNPRFVFSNRAVVTPKVPQPPAGVPGSYGYNYEQDGLAYMGPGKGGYRYKFDRNPDSDPLSQPIADLPWFTRSYYTCRIDVNGQNIQSVDPYFYDPNDTSHAFPRKPTFFDMNLEADDVAVLNDPAFPLGYRSFPDKGWYAQRNGNGGVDFPLLDANGNVAVAMKFPLQMLHKNGDFEQIGELFNIWLYGHRLNWGAGGGPGPGPGTGVVAPTTEITFSEYLKQTPGTNGNHVSLVGRGYRVNRLQLIPDSSLDLGQIIGVGDTNALTDVRHSIPDLPAAARLLDAFVCDGYGVDPYGVNVAKDYNLDGVIDGLDQELREYLVFGNAKNFDGSATPGMLNVNTAPIEAKRALPHWYRLVHETGRRRMPGDNGQTDSGVALFNYVGHPNLPPLVTDGDVPNALLPRTMVAESLWHYRERFNGLSDVMNPTPDPNRPRTGVPFGPEYEGRGNSSAPNTPDWLQKIRGDRGLASIGEIGLLMLNGRGLTLALGNNFEPEFIDRPNAGNFDRIYSQQWRVDLGLTPTYLPLNSSDSNRAKPVWGLYPNTSPAEPYQASIRISTDRIDAYDPFNSTFDPNSPASNVIVHRPDNVAGDVEEANALLAGVSNLVTTRSDTFTVYFRVRSFRQNTSVDPPVWDATNPDYIVDDSRYVMLVDRSNVNKPGDKPRILYLEKLPN